MGSAPPCPAGSGTPQVRAEALEQLARPSDGGLPVAHEVGPHEDSVGTQVAPGSLRVWTR